MSFRSSLVLPLAALMVAGTLGACAGAGTAVNAQPEPLWGSEWRLQDIGGQAVLPQPAATLAFPQTGQVAGQGSCNRFFGSVEFDRSSVKFGPLGATRMACPGGIGEQETRYLGALQKAQRYEVQGDTLLIHAQGMDKPLRFVRTTPRR
jgi:heat shock protein HslJ